VEKTGSDVERDLGHEGDIDNARARRFRTPARSSHEPQHRRRPLSTDPARPLPDTRLELRWRVQNARGRAGALVAEWVVVGHAPQQREAA